jgi:hypothetical protein
MILESYWRLRFVPVVSEESRRFFPEHIVTIMCSEGGNCLGDIGINETPSAVRKLFWLKVISPSVPVLLRGSCI